MTEGFGAESKNIDEMLRFMEEKVSFWSFSHLLEELYQEQDPLQQRIIKKFQEYEPEEKRESIERKVRNWMRDKNLPQSREELFKLGFALGLDERKTESLLGTTAENGIHYRNPRELVYAFCLRKGVDYPEARARADRILKDLCLDGSKEGTSGGVHENPQCFTGSVKNQFKHVGSYAQLEKFLLDFRPQFGSYHNTAYRKFSKMLGQLAVPEASAVLDLPREKDYSIERIVEEYLRMGVPYDKKSRKYSRINKEIKKHWPSAKSVIEMQKRKRDVDRKTLLLLYLATEGMNQEHHENSEKRAREHCFRMNLMLTECGMAVLNPHSPFDYLVLKAADTRSEEEFIGARMEQLVRRLFGREKEPAYIAEASEALAKEKRQGGDERWTTG